LLLEYFFLKFFYFFRSQMAWESLWETNFLILNWNLLYSPAIPGTAIGLCCSGSKIISLIIISIIFLKFLSQPNGWKTKTSPQTS
jgi:hypothetical protein